MDEEIFNQTLRQFLKKFGVTAQREMEQAVRAAVESGRLTGTESLPVRAHLTMEGAALDVTIDGTVRLSNH